MTKSEFTVKLMIWTLVDVKFNGDHWLTARAELQGTFKSVPIITKGGIMFHFKVSTISAVHKSRTDCEEVINVMRDKADLFTKNGEVNLSHLSVGESIYVFGETDRLFVLNLYRRVN